MLENILEHIDSKKYITSFETGHTIFLEGDTSQDLFILISGRLDVLKGNKKIVGITERGSLFGEMSFLLRAKRTATIKTNGDVKALRIPKEEITSFLHKFPDVAGKITTLLAKRLDETSRILYGLREFCDQLPDAVIATDREGKIISWNAAAEGLYGRTWDQMCNRSVEEIYETPQIYKKFLKEVKKKQAVREKILCAKHPKKGSRFISTSTTLLYDKQDQFQGTLSLGRDVTLIKKQKKKYGRSRNLILPALILLVFLTAGALLSYSYVIKGAQATNLNTQELKAQLSKDYLLAKSMLVNDFRAGDRSKTTPLIKNFLNIRKLEKLPYTGMVLLDKNKTVLDAYSLKADTDASRMIGSSYTGIEFQGNEGSIHSVLTLYRADKNHPMGQKGIELAFQTTTNNRFIGWLVFQLDPDRLKTFYGIDVTGLKQFNFNES
jgi:PAS domain S-box-containing protein